MRTGALGGRELEYVLGGGGGADPSGGGDPPLLKKTASLYREIGHFSSFVDQFA